MLPGACSGKGLYPKGSRTRTLTPESLGPYPRGMFHEALRDIVENTDGSLAGILMDAQGSRIDSYARLRAETAAWEKRRNADRARIKWMFTTKKARAKMGRAYPKPAASGQTQRDKTSVTGY